MAGWLSSHLLHGVQEPWPSPTDTPPPLIRRLLLGPQRVHCTRLDINEVDGQLACDLRIAHAHEALVIELVQAILRAREGTRGEVKNILHDSPVLISILTLLFGLFLSLFPFTYNRCRALSQQRDPAITWCMLRIRPSRL